MDGATVASGTSPAQEASETPNGNEGASQRGLRGGKAEPRPGAGTERWLFAEGRPPGQSPRRPFERRPRADSRGRKRAILSSFHRLHARNPTVPPGERARAPGRTLRRPRPRDPTHRTHHHGGTAGHLLQPTTGLHPDRICSISDLQTPKCPSPRRTSRLPGSRGGTPLIRQIPNFGRSNVSCRTQWSPKSRRPRSSE